MEETLSLRQIATALNLKYPTVVSQAKKFEDYLPKRQFDGVRWDRFQPEAQAILKLISDEYKAGKKAFEIRKSLEEAGYQPIYEAEIDDFKDIDDSVNEYSMNLLKIVEEYGDNWLTMTHNGMELAKESVQLYDYLLSIRNTQIVELQAIIEQLQAELDILKSEKSTDKARIAELEQQLAEKPPKTSFLERLTRRQSDD